MYLIVFCIFLSLSLILIALGLFRPEHSELSLVGFAFMFLLSFIIISGTLTNVTGTNTTSNFSYSVVGNYTLLTSSFENVENIYTPITLDNSHNFGYYLAIASIVGFIGTLIGLRGGFKN